MTETIEVRVTELGKRHPVVLPHRGDGPNQYVGFERIRANDDKTTADFAVRRGARYRFVGGTVRVPRTAYFRAAIRDGYLELATQAEPKAESKPQPPPEEASGGTDTKPSKQSRKG